MRTSLYNATKTAQNTTLPYLTAPHVPLICSDKAGDASEDPSNP